MAPAVVVTPVRVDLFGPALDGGRVGLGKSTLEGGRAFEVARVRLCDGTSFVFSVRLGLVALVWDRDRDRVDPGFGFSKSFFEPSVTEGGLEGPLEETGSGAFVATRLLGLSGTEVVCTGNLGLGGGTAWGRGAGSIVILLGPILGRSPGTGMIPGCTRVTPTLRCESWFMIRLGPGRAVTSTRVWDIVLILVDVVESALLVML